MFVYMENLTDLVEYDADFKRNAKIGFLEKSDTGNKTTSEFSTCPSEWYDYIAITTGLQASKMGSVLCSSIKVGAQI